MKVFQHLAQGVIAERPIFCNNSSRNEVNIDDAAIALNFRRGSRCPKIAFWQSKFPKNGSLSINYCDIFEKIV